MSNHSFLRHAVVYGLGTILLQAAGFFLLPLYMHHLSTGEFGTLEVLNRMGNVLVIALLFGGVRQATLAFMGQSKTPLEQQRIIATLMLLLLAIVSVGTGLIVMIAPWLCRLLNFANPDLLRLAAASALLEASLMAMLAVSQARQESTMYVAISVGQFVLRVCVVAFFVVKLGWGVRGILIASILVSGVINLFLAGREIYKGARRADWTRIRNMATFTLPLLPCAVGFFCLNSGDRFFLLRYASEDEVGIYALGYKLAIIVGTLVWTPFAMVWSARMYKIAEEKNAAEQFGRTFTRMWAPYLFCGLGMSLFSGEVVSILGGGSYMPAAVIIPTVVLAQLFMLSANMIDAGFYIRRRTYHKTWIAMISTVSIFALYYWLIRGWGGQGAALATLFGFIVHAIVTRLVSQRFFRVQYEPRRLVAMLGSAVGLWLLSRLLPMGWWGILVKVGLLFSWPLILWIFGAVRDDEKEQLLALVAKGRALLSGRTKAAE